MGVSRSSANTTTGEGQKGGRNPLNRWGCIEAIISLIDIVGADTKEKTSKQSVRHVS